MPLQFSQSELLLLTGSTDQDVKVHTPDVPPESTRLYPKLVGSHWECYITTDCLVLGRSPGPGAPPPRNARQHRVDVDFGSHKRDVSRRHADIRFHAHKKRWELRVYGKNGVKVNHVWKRPRSGGSVVLTTGSLLEIGDNNRFVFILPDRSAPVTTLDGRLETLITEAFKDHPLLDTTSIVDYVKQHNNSNTAAAAPAPAVSSTTSTPSSATTPVTPATPATPATPGTPGDQHVHEQEEQQQQEETPVSYDRASVLHALVLSQKFQLKDGHWSIRQEQSHEKKQQEERSSQQRTQTDHPLYKQMSLDAIEEHDDGDDSQPTMGYEKQQEQQQRKPHTSLGVSVQKIYSTWIAAKKRSLHDLGSTSEEANGDPGRKRLVPYNPETDNPWKDVMWRELSIANDDPVVSATSSRVD
ncbi:hypothetical protein BDB00DRAFT_792850 [Zychaea mexicana]|uniref:uncharacterized protein n=1 Tax=Zychaea mexicana TaxID=64656 RepID=UPI0022FE4C03|nr:uncharacterized protein BDB00DRAFT_792850 [Zychaea mexicana]KAI9484474.1 hypothetical protein BDB00DRAFT_792850 [Zychaea mexicana]